MPKKAFSKDEWKERLAKYLKGTEYALWYGNEWDLSDEVEEFVSQLLSEREEEAYKKGYLECKKDIVKLVRGLKVLIEAFNPISEDIRNKQAGELEAYNSILSKLLKEKNSGERTEQGN